MSRYISQNYSVDKIYYSTLKRAVQTAQHLMLATRAPLLPEEDLMEFDNGLLAGMKFEVAAEKYPQVEIPVHTAVYEQETMLDFRCRGERMLSKLIAENEESSTIAVVTHGGMIGQLYRAFFRLPLDSKYSFPTDDTGIHEWDIIGESRIVLRANYVACDM